MKCLFDTKKTYIINKQPISKRYNVLVVCMVRAYITRHVLHTYVATNYNNYYKPADYISYIAIYIYKISAVSANLVVLMITRNYKRIQP